MARPSPPTRRVIEVLDLLATSVDGLLASEIARRLAITSSTCAVILHALLDAEYVERGPAKTYRLGPGLASVAQAVHDRFPLLGPGRSELRRLASDLGCGVTLTHIASDHLQVVMAVGVHGQMPLGVSPGDRFPITPPYGAIAVAWRPPAEVERWLGGWPSASPEARAHERRVLEDIRNEGVGVWSLEGHAIPAVQRIRAIIEELDAGPSSDRLREQLTGLFALFGQRGYTSEELASLPTLSVGYALAAVFGPDGAPCYEIELHLLRRSMRRAEVAAVRRRLAMAAATLTNTVGGTAPSDVGRMRATGRRRAG